MKEMGRDDTQAGITNFALEYGPAVTSIRHTKKYHDSIGRRLAGGSVAF